MPVSLPVDHCVALPAARLEVLGSVREGAGPVCKLELGRSRGSPSFGGAVALSLAILAADSTVGSLG